jgi:hypothetical protein
VSIDDLGKTAVVKVLERRETNPKNTNAEDFDCPLGQDAAEVFPKLIDLPENRNSRTS